MKKKIYGLHILRKDGKDFYYWPQKLEWRDRAFLGFRKLDKFSETKTFKCWRYV